MVKSEHYVRGQNTIDESQDRHESDLCAVAGERKKEGGSSRDRCVVSLELIYSRDVEPNNSNKAKIRTN